MFRLKKFRQNRRAAMRIGAVATVVAVLTGMVSSSAMAFNEDEERKSDSGSESAIPEVVDLSVGVHQDGGSGGSGKPGVPCPVGNLSGQTLCRSGFGGVWNYRSCYQRAVLDTNNPTGYVVDATQEAFASKIETLRNEHTDAEGNFTGTIIECATPFPCSDKDLCLTSNYFWSPFAVSQASAQLAALGG